MTVYMYSPELHKQVERIIADASWHIPEGSPLDRDAESTLAMLKAMKPVGPLAFAAFADNGNIRLWSSNYQDAVKAPQLKPLYAKEQQ